MVNKSKEKIEYIVIFIATFFSATSGVEILGISMSKVAIIPLVIYLLFTMTSKVTLNSAQKSMLIWYACAIMSGIIGLLSRYSETFIDYNNRVLLFAIQIVIIYLPILLFAKRITNVYNKFIKAIIITAKINVLWAITQFVLWQGFQIDFNSIVFDDVFRGFFGNNWTSWSYEAGQLGLRVTGINKDSAYLSIIMIFGFAFSNSKIWKALFALAIALSMSRTGMLAILFCFCLQILEFLKEKNARKAFKILVLSVCSIVFAFFVINKIPSLKGQIEYAFFRLQDIFISSDKQTISTSRHIAYITIPLAVWFQDMGIIHKLFGMGPRVGGVALVSSDLSKDIVFSRKMFTHAWAIECDYAELLLGHGILGYIIYWVFFRLYQMGDRKDKQFILTFLVMGFFYCYIDITLMQIFILFLCVKNGNVERKRDEL